MQWLAYLLPTKGESRGSRVQTPTDAYSFHSSFLSSRFEYRDGGRGGGEFVLLRVQTAVR